MPKSSILVADSSESSRNRICTYLNKRGYKTYQASDGLSAVRMASSVYPDLTIIDFNLWNADVKSIAFTIEKSGYSNIIFMSRNPNLELAKIIDKMKLYAYIKKPINLEEIYRTILFSEKSLEKISELENKLSKIQKDINKKKIIDRAKFKLIETGMTEEQAHKHIQKLSMDECKSAVQISEEILKK